MKYIADLHIHSLFSRATSKESNLAGLFGWARIKGINLLGTGDFTHPGWFKQLREHLLPAEPGFFRLKDEKIRPPLEIATAPIEVRFILTAEISSIYKRGGKVRKIHNILFVPDFEAAARVNAKLAALGNIESDGRPILGLDSRDLLEILLEQAPQGFMVPAHIWTPWFSLFGSKSGFDAIEECYGDLTPEIFALETGLSSDPDMNRLISALDRFTLISNSDCHSPAKLGRECNLFDTGFDYFSMREALRRPETGFGGTVEFFPEEGKYHTDGHRKCQVCLEPQETRRLKFICPVCHSPLTVGVLHRVHDLADRQTPFYAPGSPKVHSLIPLPELLGEILRLGPNTKGVMLQYQRIIAKFGSEFNLYLQAEIEEINTRVSPLLGEAIRRMRHGRVLRHPGYDGEFGVIQVFEPGEIERLAGQGGLFGDAPSGRTNAKKTATIKTPIQRSPRTATPLPAALQANPEQEQAINASDARILVTAGPGTGKTFTLTARMSHLLSQPGAIPEQFTAITFTNRAAAEIRQRLDKTIGPATEKVFIGTFHQFCLTWLHRQEAKLTVIGAEDRELLLKNLLPELDRSQRLALGRELLDFYRHGGIPDAPEIAPDTSPQLKRYLGETARQKIIELDGVIPLLLSRLRQDAAFRAKVCQTIDHLFVDEFQDLNRSQFELVELLAARASVFAIGDPDQAIYSFQGSDLNFFFRFAATDSTSCLSLERNYRSAPAIIQAATAVISHNSQRGQATLRAESHRQTMIEQFQAVTLAVEAEWIVKRIEELLGGISNFSINSGRGGPQEEGGRSFADIAILCRLSRQTTMIAEALGRRGIPYQMVGGTPFFLAPGLRAAYYWLRVAANLARVADYLGLLRELKGFGQSSLERLEQIPVTCEDFLRAALLLAPDAAWQKKINEVRHTLDGFRTSVATQGLNTGLEMVLPFLCLNPEDEAVRRLLNLAGAFGHELTTFAAHLADHARETIYDNRAEAVALMTLHSSKGLEFPVVFMAGLEDGCMPWIMPGQEDNLEEERRLFYVGLTRAREQLILTSPPERALPGSGRGPMCRFIKEIPPHLVQQMALHRQKKKKPESKQKRLF